MMASPSELTLDCKPQSYSILLKSFADQPDQPMQKLEEYLTRLEEERLKIDAFKRELPLCMQLLTNEMEVSKQQLQSYRVNQDGPPMLEEFIPLKHSNTDQESDQNPGNNSTDKASWMTSAQLWSQADEGNKNHLACPNEEDIAFNVSPKLGLVTKQRNGGAFLPFTKERNSGPSIATRALPDLALLPGGDLIGIEDKKCSDQVEHGVNGLRSDYSAKVGNGTVGGKPTDIQTSTTMAANTTSGAATTTTTSQAHRKARRCWSPELHRRFVNALQMLGGSQVATPKQIRELMKVDGLTNDEVKSHLQKYRLHTRRPSPSPQAPGTPAPQLVILGGLWVQQEYATAPTAHGGGGATATIYSTHPASHQVPQHYRPIPPAGPQDFYPVVSPHQAQMHHHQQLHTYKTTSSQTMISSPESDARGTGSRSDQSIEDGKSDDGSWKGHSVRVDGEERKKMMMVIARDGDEESNGSEITLKF
ncbi:hypothetical protein Dimus_034419 [Dionaea muscipula]